MSLLKDQKNRDAILETEKSCLISAGAGTGKSTMMTQKIIEIIKKENLTNLERIVVITYTEQATKDLLKKIETALHEEMNKNLDKNMKKNLEDAILNYSKIKISTIHSFCLDWCRLYSINFNYTPQANVLHEADFKMYLETIFMDYLTKIERDKNPIVKEWNHLLNSFKNNLDSIIKYFYELYEKKETLKKLNNDSFLITTEDQVHELSQQAFKFWKNKFNDFLQYYNLNHPSDSKPQLTETIQNLLIYIKTYNTWEECIQNQSLLNFTKYRSATNCISNELPEYINSSKDYVIHLNLFHSIFIGKALDTKELDKIEGSLYFDTILKKHHLLGTHPQQFKNEYLKYLWYYLFNDFLVFLENKKQKNNIIIYEDMLLQMNQILHNNESKQKILDSIDFLFIDELQDSDYLQFSIFDQIISSGSVRWFCVGDFQQAIYGFRGSSPKYFQELQKKAEFTEKLTVNMRSSVHILEFLNFFFTKSSIIQQYLHHFQTLHPKSNSLENQASNCASFHFSYVPPNDYPTKAYHYLEAHWIASKIKSILKRNPNFKIAILFRSLNHIQIYFKVLHEIGYEPQVLKRSTVFYAYRLYPFLNFCECLVNQYNYTAFIGFLKYYVKHRKLDTNKLDNFIKINFKDTIYKNPNIFCLHNIPNFLHEVYTLLKEIYFTSFTMPIVELLLYIKKKLPIFNELFNDFPILFNTAYQLKPDITTHKALKIYLENLQTLIKENKSYIRAEENLYSNIMMMSIHAAKGLEFDVTFIADLNYNLSPHGRQNLFYWDLENTKTPFGFKLDLLKNILNQKHPYKVNKVAQEQENTRLLYVALTRAKFESYLLLDVNTYKKGNNKNSFNHWLIHGLEEVFKMEFTNDIESHSADLESKKQYFNNEQNFFHTTLEKIEDFILQGPLEEHLKKKYYIKRILPKKIPPLNISSSTINFSSATQLIEYKNDINIPQNNKRNSSTLPATQLGILIHAMFEKINLKDKNSKLVWTIKNTEYLLESHQINPIHLNIVHKNLIKSLEIYKTSSLKEILENAHILGSEVPFSIKENHTIFTGYLDLLFMDPSNIIWIVDYKSNKTDEKISFELFKKELINKYKVGMLLYKQVIQERYLQHKIQLALYHTHTGELIFVDSM